MVRPFLLCKGYVVETQSTSLGNVPLKKHHLLGMRTHNRLPSPARLQKRRACVTGALRRLFCFAKHYAGVQQFTPLAECAFKEASSLRKTAPFEDILPPYMAINGRRGKQAVTAGGLRISGRKYLTRGVQ
jgi:hypothetical protein